MRVPALRKIDIRASRQQRQRLAEFSLLDHHPREVVESCGKVRMCRPQHALIQFQRSAPILLGARPVLLEIRDRAELIEIFRNLGVQPTLRRDPDRQRRSKLRRDASRLSAICSVETQGFEIAGHRRRSRAIVGMVPCRAPGRSGGRASS